MAERYHYTPKQRQQRKEDVFTKLEQGVASIQDSQSFSRYLALQAKFHHYSANNVILILAQRPESTMVASFRRWQEDFDRHVKKGEQGIRILAPTFTKEEETGDQVLRGFIPVPVFDVSQWELCVLNELRGALRAGDVWVVGSRRYANPETYLIPPERWPALRPDVVALVGAASTAEDRLDACQQELTDGLRRLDQVLGRENGVRVVDGELVVGRLTAEEVADDTVALRQLIADRLPRVDLADLLIEVDQWTGFSTHFTHAGGSATRMTDLAVHVYAAILAQAGNFGPTTMAEIAGLTYRRLAWTTEW